MRRTHFVHHQPCQNLIRPADSHVSTRTKGEHDTIPEITEAVSNSLVLESRASRKRGKVAGESAWDGFLVLPNYKRSRLGTHAVGGHDNISHLPGSVIVHNAGLMFILEVGADRPALLDGYPDFNCEIEECLMKRGAIDWHCREFWMRQGGVFDVRVVASYHSTNWVHRMSVAAIQESGPVGKDPEGRIWDRNDGAWLALT